MEKRWFMLAARIAVVCSRRRLLAELRLRNRATNALIQEAELWCGVPEYLVLHVSQTVDEILANPPRVLGEDSETIILL